jgi:hypothetical protein
LNRFFFIFFRVLHLQIELALSRLTTTGPQQCTSALLRTYRSSRASRIHITIPTAIVNHQVILSNFFCEKAEVSESLGRQQHCDERHSGAKNNKDGRINGSAYSQISFFQLGRGFLQTSYFLRKVIVTLKKLCDTHKGRHFSDERQLLMERARDADNEK